MKKMSIAEAAEYLGVSKEAVHNRIRRNSIQSVVENGVKLVLIDEEAAKNKARASRRTVSNIDDKYYTFLKEQNQFLQNRVDKLENETRDLREQKEQMLIDERDKIEQIYKEKDEQLKNILNAISSKFMLDTTESLDQLSHNNEDIEAEIEESVEELETASETVIVESNPISLKKYLKQLGCSDKKKTKIKKAFKKQSKKDGRIIIIGDKYYVDTKKYDYTDLIKS